MNEYPIVVAKIAGDYIDRVKRALGALTEAEKAEFVREIESHIFEAYQEMPGGAEGESGEVDRMLAVLRKMGEPSELVADRLPRAMIRKGTRWHLPFYILGGLVVALFGLPLGAGGVAVLTGMLAAIVWVALAYYAAVAAVLVSGLALLALGMMRLYAPGLWDRLVAAGFLHWDDDQAGLFAQLLPGEQGILMVALACVFVACAIGGLWLGRYLLRGLRFLFGLIFEQGRKLAANARRHWQQRRQRRWHAAQVAYSAR